MKPHWLSLIHGFLFGLPTLVLVGHGLVVCWEETLDALEVRPHLRSAFQQRLELWTVLAWATVISGGLCLWCLDRPLTSSLWMWKIGSGVLGAILLTEITLQVRRGACWGKTPANQKHNLLLGLALAEAGFFVATLLGALSHYFP